MNPSLTRLAMRILGGVVWLPIAEMLWAVAWIPSKLASPLLVGGHPKISRRMALKKELEIHFLPALRAAGFAGPEEFKGSDLVFEFHRRAGENQHALEIQFDKYGGPKFRINFYEGTKAGIVPAPSADAETPLKRVESILGKRSGIMVAGRVPEFQTYCWFNTSSPYCRLRAMCSRKAPAEVMARQVTRLFHSELEPWWAHRRRGLHLHIMEDWARPGDESWRARLARQLVWFYWLYGLAVTGFFVLFLTIVPCARLIRWLAAVVVHWFKSS